MKAEAEDEDDDDRDNGARMKRATWAWAPTRDAESWTGFSSRMAAETYGRKQAGNLMPPGFVAPCVWPDPATIALGMLDADELLARMEEIAAEDFWAEVGPLFELRGGIKAERALATAIGHWARHYVRATSFSVETAKAEEVSA